MPYCNVQPFRIGHAAIVVAVGLLIQVAEQMERLNTHVGALDGALQERPEILQSVGMDFATNVLNGMVNYFMLKLIKALVGSQGICEQSGPGQNVLAKLGLKRLLFGGRNHLDMNLAGALWAALQNAH